LGDATLSLSLNQGSQTAPRAKWGLTKLPVGRIMATRSTRGLLCDVYATMTAAQP